LQEPEASYNNKTQALMKLKYYKRSAVIFVSCNESQVSEEKRAETCGTNYPANQRITRPPARYSVFLVRQPGDSKSRD
jgi:hypothetical protein